MYIRKLEIVAIVVLNKQFMEIVNDSKSILFIDRIAYTRSAAYGYARKHEYVIC